MINNKKLVIALFIFFALPLPLSLIAWFASFNSLITAVARLLDAIIMISIGRATWHRFYDLLAISVLINTLLLADTYPITYIFSLKATFKAKKISILSFLPLLHIIPTAIFYYLLSQIIMNK